MYHQGKKAVRILLRFFGVCAIVFAVCVLYFVGDFMVYKFGGDFQDYLKIEDVRGKLALDLPSYSSFDEVKLFLNLGDDRIVILGDSRSPATARRPQFNTLTVVIENFEIEEYPGKLRLLFLNDRLQSTRFYPEAFDEFISSLELDRTALQSEAGIMKDSYTRMWMYNKHVLDEPYLRWEDVRLAKQSSDWIRRHA